MKSGKVKLHENHAVVVEIGNDWLKVLEYAHSSSGGEVTRMALQKLAHIKDNMSVAIAKIFKNLSLSRQGVVLCLPRHLITVRVLDLPSTDSKEINDMLNLQIGKQTPYSKEEIVSAHKIVSTAREGYTKVMLAIAHRSIVNVRIETLKNAGIDISKVAISSEGVCSWFDFTYPDMAKPSDTDSVALLDVDSNYSDFIAIRGGKTAFTKNIFLGANHLADKPEGWREKLIEELKRCVKRYYIEEKNTKITKLYLSGAAKNVEDIDLILSRSLDIVTEKADTFKNIKIKKEAAFAESQNLKYVSLTPLVGTAMGRASSEIDLTPPEHKILKHMERKRKELTVMGVLFVSAAMVLSFLLSIGFYYKSAYLARLKKKVAEASGESAEINKMRQGINLAKHALDAGRSSLNILHEIYRQTPPEISLSSIDIDEDKQVVLKGRGFSMSDIFKFIKKLEDSPVFANVKASYTRTKKEKELDKETEYVEFEIICHYKNTRGVVDNT